MKEIELPLAKEMPRKLFAVKRTCHNHIHREEMEGVSSDWSHAYAVIADEFSTDEHRQVRETFVPEKLSTQTHTLDGKNLETPITTLEKAYKMFYKSSFEEEIVSEESFSLYVQPDPSIFYNLRTYSKITDEPKDEKQRQMFESIARVFDDLKSKCGQFLYFGEKSGRHFFGRPTFSDGMLYLNATMIGEMR